MKCRIVALQCGIYSCLKDGELYKVPAKGIFRNKNIKPVVGDLIELDEEKGVISEVYERVSFLKRPTITNLDQMIIVHSLVEPEFSFDLLFKYLTYANINGISAKIILTKLDKADKKLVEEIKEVYTKLGVETYFVSNKKGDGINEVKKIFTGHISCLLGQSGVGKSSLLNSIDNNFQRSVGEYSKALGRGKHKTKEVILIPYENGLIAIRCEGQGKGEEQGCNSYRLNYEAINAYSEMSYQDLQNPRLKIKSKSANHKGVTLYMQANNPFPFFYNATQNVDTIEELQEKRQLKFNLTAS